MLHIVSISLVTMETCLTVASERCNGNLEIFALNALFRCSICRSRGMLLPAPLRTEHVLFHWSSCARLALSITSRSAISRNASRTYLVYPSALQCRGRNLQQHNILSPFPSWHEFCRFHVSKPMFMRVHTYSSAHHLNHFHHEGQLASLLIRNTGYTLFWYRRLEECPRR